LYSVYRNKIVALIVGIISTLTAVAQPNQEQYDNQWLHFGFTLCTNTSRMRVDTYMSQIATDSVKNVTMTPFPGIGLGGITNLRLGKHFDIRLMFPVISFVQRNLTYEFPTQKKEVKVESAYCDASLLVKFKSSRRKNIRAYVIVGPRYSYDLASTIKKDRSMKNPVVSLKKSTWGYDAGFGLDIYFPFFKLSPEIKVSNTMINALHYDGFIYTSIIQNISPQMVVFSLHFE
jgi:hypothetical protein